MEKRGKPGYFNNNKLNRTERTDRSDFGDFAGRKSIKNLSGESTRQPLVLFIAALRMQSACSSG